MDAKVELKKLIDMDRRRDEVKKLSTDKNNTHYNKEAMRIFSKVFVGVVKTTDTIQVGDYYLRHNSLCFKEYNRHYSITNIKTIRRIIGDCILTLGNYSTLLDDINDVAPQEIIRLIQVKDVVTEKLKEFIATYKAHSETAQKLSAEYNNDLDELKGHFGKYFLAEAI